MTNDQTLENKNSSSTVPTYITKAYFVELEEWQNWDAIGLCATQSTSGIKEVL